MQIQFNHKTMNIKLLKTEGDYLQALELLSELFDAKMGTSESDEADVLALLVDEYEKKHYPIDSPDPIEAIKIRMEEMRLRQIDIANELGGKNRASEVLGKKRKLTVDMIRNLTSRLHLSPKLLINDYKLAREL